MRNYFVIDFKKYGGAEAFRKVISGHNARKRNAKRPNVDPARTSNNIELSPLRWKSHADMMEELNAKAKESGGRRLKKGSAEWFSIVVDCSVMEGWDEEKYIQYLKVSEQWLRSRFKGHPVLHSVIHMDEKKPHLHISFSYFNEDIGRWSQKRLAQKQLTDLDQLLSDFELEVGTLFGLRRGDHITEKNIIKRLGKRILKYAKTYKVKTGLFVSEEEKAIPVKHLNKIILDIIKLAFEEEKIQLDRALERINELEWKLKQKDEEIRRVKEANDPHRLRKNLEKVMGVDRKKERSGRKVYRSIDGINRVDPSR